MQVSGGTSPVNTAPLQAEEGGDNREIQNHKAALRPPC
ncbi:Uncharacterised protein [Vibrio cholerae]|nr:Uncharacterised protein [Vibrio cholerae]